jgi:ABC-2 type transport system ATP-binding protein
MNIIETTGLGKCYGKSVGASRLHPRRARRVPGRTRRAERRGEVHADEHGSRPDRADRGTATVLGGQAAGSPAALDDIAFMAQDAPVYKNLSVADMLHLTRNLNRRFDDATARARLADLGIPLNKKTGKLSGGQQSQVALTVALARRPRLLILDEPLSALDPLARQDFLATVMTAMTDDGVSVLLSSHALAELERVADYLIVLGGGELRIAGEVDDLLAKHQVMTGPAADADRLAAQLSTVQVKRAGAQAHLMVSDTEPGRSVPPGWEAHPVGLEELVLAYLRQVAGATSSVPASGSPTELTEVS